MHLFFHALEKLSDYSGHDYDGNHPASFVGPEAVPGDSVYRYRFGTDIVERAIREGEIREHTLA